MRGIFVVKVDDQILNHKKPDSKPTGENIASLRQVLIDDIYEVEQKNLRGDLCGRKHTKER